MAEREVLGNAVEDSTPNGDGTHTVEIARTKVRFDGVAGETIAIGSRVTVEINTATGQAIVWAAPTGSNDHGK